MKSLRLDSDDTFSLLILLVTFIVTLIDSDIFNNWMNLNLDYYPVHTVSWLRSVDLWYYFDYLGIQSAFGLVLSSTLAGLIVWLFCPDYNAIFRQRNLIILEMILASIVSLGIYGYFYQDYGPVLIHLRESTLYSIWLNGILGMIVFWIIRAIAIKKYF